MIQYLKDAMSVEMPFWTVLLGIGLGLFFGWLLACS